MADLMIYLARILNSLINCIEIFLEYIWYLPILGTTLGNIIFSLIILFMALKLYEKWIYNNKSNTKNNESTKSTSKTATAEELESWKRARKERSNNK